MPTNPCTPAKEWWSPRSPWQRRGSRGLEIRRECHRGRRRRRLCSRRVALASQGKKHLNQQTITGLEVCLDPHCFVRIHRSYIVNLERVARIEPYGKDSRLAILADGTRLPVSRAGYARLQSLLDERK